jgi:hypothetical protein
LRHWLPGVLCRAAACSVRSGTFDLRRHIGELELDRLKFRDRLAELLPFFGIFDCRFDSTLAMPTDNAAIEMRPPSSTFIAC